MGAQFRHGSRDRVDTWDERDMQAAAAANPQYSENESLRLRVLQGFQACVSRDLVVRLVERLFTYVESITDGSTSFQSHAGIMADS
jgi:hypothetical protein